MLAERGEFDKCGKKSESMCCRPLMIAALSG